jgi:hypothetical protein
MMKITAVTMRSPTAKTVTSQMTIFGKNKPISMTKRLRPTEIRTAQRRSSMALWEFHLSKRFALKRSLFFYC